MINIDSLRNALAPLSELAHKRLTFEVRTESGQLIPVTLRSLSPNEELEVNRWAAASANELDDEVDDEEEASEASARSQQHIVMDFFNHLRVGALSYSLVAIGDQEFDTDRIATGETLSNGVAVSRKKHEVLREIMQTWNKSLMSKIYLKYTELLEEVESTADRAIDVKEDEDLDEAISRSKERMAELEKLKREKKKAENDKHDQLSRQVQQAAELEAERTRQLVAEAQRQAAKRREEFMDRDKEAESGVKAAPQATHQASEQSVEEPPVPHSPEPEPQAETTSGLTEDEIRQIRQSVVPTQVDPPPSREEVPLPPKEAVPQSSFDSDAGSLVDFDDPKAVQAAVAREERRLRAMHEARLASQRAQQARQAQEAELQSTHGPMPHQRANRANRAAQVAQGDDARSLRGAEQVGTHKGVEVFRLPTVALDEPGPVHRKSQPLPQNQRSQGSVNPNFVRKP